jgi:uncharacterized membrane protein
MPVPQKPDQMAVAAMGVGIASIPLSLLGCCCTPLGVLGLVAGVVGLVLGLIAKKNIDQSGGMKTGTQQATTGLITGAVGAGVSILAIVLVVVFNVASFNSY